MFSKMHGTTLKYKLAKIMQIFICQKCRVRFGSRSDLGKKFWIRPHCKEDPIYVFSEIELCGLSPNFYNHVSVSDLYILTIGPPIFLQQNRQTDRGSILYKSLTET